MHRHLRTLLLSLSIGICSLAGTALAQTWPTRPITIVVPFAAGGPTDILARTLATKMSENMGQPVVVENRLGASGAIGMGSVARAKADGYTLLYTPNSVAIIPALFRQLPFDAEKDLVPVSQFARTTLVLVAHPKVGISTVRELIARAKAQPGKLNFGSAGVADPLQLGVELLKTSGGIDMQGIPYKGQGPMLAALLAGEVDLAIVSLQVALAPIQAGNRSNGKPTSPLRTSNLTSTASAGAVRYSTQMNTRVHATD